MVLFGAFFAAKRVQRHLIADASCRNTDVSIAVRRGSGVRSRIGAFHLSPTSVSVASH
ncbi:hypothetical protein [Streptomyces sp. NPDC058745]|uniref:hypothetical protein n=1 Tax=Streptomyces sp. NPDC058745 TaxID=3346621 RepID=UPI0036780711